MPKKKDEAAKKPAKKRKNNKRTESAFIATALLQLERNGYVASRVDRYNAFSRRSNDLFGFADVLALPTENNEKKPMLVQVTSVENKAARIEKIKENETYHRLKKTCDIFVAALKKSQGAWVVQWHAIEENVDVYLR
jgi:hypothetical protein